jgi:hypothetical protein
MATEVAAARRPSGAAGSKLVVGAEVWSTIAEGRGPTGSQAQTAAPRRKPQPG